MIAEDKIEKVSSSWSHKSAEIIDYACTVIKIDRAVGN